MNIPEDPYTLLSFVNMKLRDGDYEDLTDLCATLDCDESIIRKKLEEAGFEYNADLKQFR
ncbi:MAG: DUF4250 domain-containing protein [Muribaculaceae bacterium]|nr:DUF4250 domain-containing protein [Muribaculaceae bacterium]